MQTWIGLALFPTKKKLQEMPSNVSTSHNSS